MKIFGSKISRVDRQKAKIFEVRVMITKRSWRRKREASQITRHKTHYLYLIDPAPTLTSDSQTRVFSRTYFKVTGVTEERTNIEKARGGQLTTSSFFPLLNFSIRSHLPLQRINLLKRNVHFRNMAEDIIAANQTLLLESLHPIQLATNQVFNLRFTCFTF